MTTKAQLPQRGFPLVNGDGTLTIYGLEFLQRLVTAAQELQAKTVNIEQGATSLELHGGVDTGSTTAAGQDFFADGVVRIQTVGSTADGAAVIRYFRGTTEEFRVAGDGDVVNTNNSYGAISDERAKDGIEDARSQWDDVKAFRLRNFTLKGDDRRLLGVVAQEIEAVSPGVVKTDADGMKSVAYSLIYMKAVGALQEAQARIEALEARLAASEPRRT